MNRNRPESLAEAAKRINRGESVSDTVGEFLDEFYGAEPERKPLMIASEPEAISPIRDAYLSAVAEALAYWSGFPAPTWVFQKRFFLEKPWFATDIEGLKPLLLAESPVFFRRRNLFVSGNALSRA